MNLKEEMLAFVIGLEGSKSSSVLSSLTQLEDKVIGKATSDLDVYKELKMFKLVTILAHIHQANSKAVEHMRQHGPSSLILEKLAANGRLPSRMGTLASLLELKGSSVADVDRSYLCSAVTILVSAAAALATYGAPVDVVQRLENMAVNYCDLPVDKVRAALVLGPLERGLLVWKEMDLAIEKAAVDMDGLIDEPQITLQILSKALETTKSDLQKQSNIRKAIGRIVRSIIPKTTEEYRAVIKGLQVSTYSDISSIISFLRSCGPIQNWYKELDALNLSAQSIQYLSDVEKSFVFANKSKRPDGFGDNQLRANNKAAKSTIIELDAPVFLTQNKRLRKSPYYDSIDTPVLEVTSSTTTIEHSTTPERAVSILRRPNLRSRPTALTSTATSSTTSSKKVEANARELQTKLRRKAIKS